MIITGAIVGTAALGLIVSLFGDRYECSPEEVQAACDELSNISNNTLQAINEEIGKNVTIVNNAAYGYVDISNMNAYAPAVQDSITNLIGVLDKQAQIIEEYNNGSLVEKMLGTGTMAILNLTEGVLKFGEDIVDAGANIIAGVGTFCGFDMEEVELWAAKDHVGNWFDNAFENGPFNLVEKYSIYSHESTAAEIIKGVGTAIPYIALAATGVGIAAEAGIAGAAGFGRGSTNYQQQHLVYDANGEASFDDTYSTGSMMWEGTKQGAIDAVLTVGMDKGFKALGKGISKLKAGKAAGEAGEKLLTEGTEAAVQKATTEGAEKTAQKVATQSTEKTAQKVVTEGTESAAQKVVSKTDDAVLSETKQELLKKMKNGEITRDEMLDGVRKAANPEAALTKDKATLLEKFKSGEITRDEMIQGIQKSAGNAPAENIVKNATSQADDLLRVTSKTEQKIVKEGSETVGKKIATEADDIGKNAFERYAEKMGSGESTKYENLIRNSNKVSAETAEQMAKKASAEAAEKTVQKVATEGAEKAVQKVATEGAEKAAQKVATEGAEKAAQSGSKWQSPLQAQTPAAKVTKAYDNAAAGLKNVGQKAGTAAKKVATDTATFVKENPKSALIGGGLIAAEKTIGNMKTSYIPTDYASGEIKNFAATGNGETRIVIDDVDDITIPSTSPEQSASTGSTGSGYSGGTYTPSSPDLKPTTPGQNSDSSTTEKTPEKTTDNEKNNNPSKNPDDANKSTTDDNKTSDDNKTTDSTPTPSKDESSVVSNPPSSNNNQSTSGVNHGGTTTNNNSGNNNWNSNPKTDSNNETTSELEPELEPELPIEDPDLIDEPNEEESVYTIPSNLSGVKTTKKTSSGSSVLPILGGLGAAAAVGVGAKMYLDNKKNNENGDDDEEYSEGDDENFNTSENNDLLADEWNGEDTEFNYENPSGSSIVEPDDDDLGEM